ncbi:uncharacterized protein LOC122264591 [Penaeus japonicus]|uniref:uncharacterized protein LOC122264591 n=1 Tax=Penaeus japonicus TaxID=27405 RepID=UPI001C70B421|nr:uncharacterized protein LOC122264591 [Penaeus japonicus]
MRLVRRRGLAWREAALKAAAAQNPPSSTDKWNSLLHQLKAARTCDNPACRGGHAPDQDHIPITVRRESRASIVQREAEQEELFRGYTTRLLILLGFLLAGLTGLVIYTLLSSPTMFGSRPPAAKPPP